MAVSVHQVHPLTHPGQAPTRVTTFEAPDGTEQLCRAIDAVDGALDLSHPGLARLLAIVSDTHHIPEEIACPLRLSGSAPPGRLRVEQVKPAHHR